MASEPIALASLITYVEERRTTIDRLWRESGEAPHYAGILEELDEVHKRLTALRDAIRARHAEHVRHLPAMWTDSVASDMVPTVRNARATELRWVLGESAAQENT